MTMIFSLLSIIVALVVVLGFTMRTNNAVVPADTPRETEEGFLEQAKDAAQILGGGAELDLSNQGLTRVPDGTFGKTQLTTLDLSHNALSGALPAEVRHLQALRTLDLSHNNFTGVPAEVGQLSQLEVLNLSHNPITGLPYELGNLSSLRVLDLRGTQYAQADLEVIRQGLPASTQILVD